MKMVDGLGGDCCLISKAPTRTQWAQRVLASFLQAQLLWEGISTEYQQTLTLIFSLILFLMFGKNRGNSTFYSFTYTLGNILLFFCLTASSSLTVSQKNTHWGDLTGSSCRPISNTPRHEVTPHHIPSQIIGCWSLAARRGCHPRLTMPLEPLVANAKLPALANGFTWTCLLLAHT